MENFENDIFEFGNMPEEELEQTNNFYYDSIVGLGESDYENEDLFNTEVDSQENLTQKTDFRITDFNGTNYEDSNEYNKEPIGNIEDFNDSDFILEQEQQEEPKIDDNMLETPFVSNSKNDKEEDLAESVSPFEEEQETLNSDMLEEPLDSNSENNKEEDLVKLVPQSDEEQNEEVEQIILSDTPIEELKELTEYEENKIEETDINRLFDRVSINVQDASDIFRKNTDLKQKIDTRFEELKKIQSEIENSRKTQIDEINAYKDEVYNKLTEKKDEIEKRLNLLKETQATLEKEKQEFEVYKKKEQQNIDRIQKEVQSAYDDRREELSHIEDVLRKQKDALDEERSQLSLDRIQYEADKNELANNLLKFNELVNTFTNGVGDLKE